VVRAAAISGVASQNPGTKLLVYRPTTFYLGWDDDNIYLAARTWIPPGYKPRVSGRAPGTATAFDDGLELGFKPMGANLVPGRADASFRFIATCLGSDGEYARVSVGQLFRNWRLALNYKTRLTPEGSAPLGGRWWEGEMVLPAKDFELVGPNRTGDIWRVLLGFNHIPGFTQTTIPSTVPTSTPPAGPNSNSSTLARARSLPSTTCPARLTASPARRCD
jgi:hypothetical protein